MSGAPKYTRVRPTEKQVIETLIRQGAKIKCGRSGVRITLENVGRLQREHKVDLHTKRTNEEKRAIDNPEYWFYSLAEAHAEHTFGKGATTAGTSIGNAAKGRRMDTGKMATPLGLKPDIAAANDAAFGAAALLAGDKEGVLEIKFGKVQKGSKLLGVTVYHTNPDTPKRPRPKPKMRGPGFDKTRTRKMNGKVVARKPRRKQ